MQFKNFAIIIVSLYTIIYIYAQPSYFIIMQNYIITQLCLHRKVLLFRIKIWLLEQKAFELENNSQKYLCNYSRILKLTIHITMNNYFPMKSTSIKTEIILIYDKRRCIRLYLHDVERHKWRFHTTLISRVYKSILATSVKTYQFTRSINIFTLTLQDLSYDSRTTNHVFFLSISLTSDESLKFNNAKAQIFLYILYKLYRVPKGTSSSSLKINLLASGISVITNAAMINNKSINYLKFQLKGVLKLLCESVTPINRLLDVNTMARRQWRKWWWRVLFMKTIKSFLR